jgi:hypothetical protein
MFERIAGCLLLGQATVAKEIPEKGIIQERLLLWSANAPRRSYGYDCR